MARHVALLRAVNVGGTGKLPMAALRETLSGLGYTNVRTLLASGNAVFDSPRASPQKLEAQIEGALAARAGIETDVMVRSRSEWEAIIAHNPLSAEAEGAPGKAAVMIMKQAPDLPALHRYLNGYTGPEQVAAGERCLYLHYPDGMGRSKLALPKSVGAGTVRNWNTTRKIAAALGAEPAS